MADEFQGGVCGGNWWNSSRNVFVSSSNCSSNDIVGFGWPGDHMLVDMKTSRSSDESASVTSDGSVVLQDHIHIQKPHKQDSANGICNISMDSSTLQMMDNSFSTSPTTTNWNQVLFQNNSGSESNYSCMLQENLNSSMNYGQESGMNCHQTIQKVWSPRNYSATTSHVSDDSSTNTFEPMNQSFALDHHQHLSSMNSSTTFAMNSPSSSSYGYNPLMQTLFDRNPQTQQKSSFDHQSMNFPSTNNYLASLKDFSPNSLPKLSPMLKASLPKHNNSPFSSNTSLWNTSAAALNDIRATLLPSSRVRETVHLPNLTAKHKNVDVGKRTNDEPAFKRPRIETPSPLPTFKVRKEKLGDRITALQQLVSPFGKTDTASVLHEAIEYIKFLHDQVIVLSTPYMKNGSSSQRQQGAEKTTEQEGRKEDLSSRGLCLVPVSSTFPITTETTTDFWTPTFGGAFSKEKWEAWKGGHNGMICKY